MTFDSLLRATNALNNYATFLDGMAQHRDLNRTAFVHHLGKRARFEKGADKERTSGDGRRCARLQQSRAQGVIGGICARHAE